MALPSTERTRVDALLTAYCAARAHPQIRHEYRVRGHNVTLVECRPSFRRPADDWTASVVAQFRFDPVRLTWSLYCADRNSKWHLYSRTPPSKRLEALLKAVTADVTGIFWG